MSNIVTRFAPSPTGSLHVGGLRTALYNFVYAKKHGGKFILRIEDTDEVRSTDDSLRGIVRDLKWGGIDWDEGPSKNENDLRANQIGPNGPYFQSQRKDIYNEYIDKMLKNGSAYEKDGAVFFAMPKEDVAVHDLILGDILFPANQCQDLVIRKATGMPTFHFAVVIDDATMGITHIIRGQEHLQNAWKHIALQKALDLQTPQYAHIPLIMNTDGSKMSKRQKTGQVNTIDFKRDGYLSSVLLNYLALLGWSPNDGTEKFGINKMIKLFDVADIGKANARFDYKKLASFNGDAINKMPDTRFENMMLAYLDEFHVSMPIKYMDKMSPDEFRRVLKLYKPRIKTLKDFVDLTRFIVEDVKPVQADLDKFIVKNNHEGLTLLEEFMGILSSIEWNNGNIDGLLESFAKDKQIGVGKIAQPIRLAITGGTVSPPIGDTLAILGKTESLNRIRSFVNSYKLVGV